MPQFIASYDIPNGPDGSHDAFKAAAYGNGWKDEFVSHTGFTGKMPNTTLWGQFVDMATAEAAFMKSKGDAERKIGRQIPVAPYVIGLCSESKMEPSTAPKRGGLMSFSGFASRGR